jgi:hypothetical protein
MNYLTAMLLGTVQLPPPAPKRPYTPRTWNTGEANKARHEQAVAKYKAVMGSEWVKTSTIESRLGVCRTACTGSLNHYLDLELLERRPVGETYVRRRGYEWRFK